MNSSSRFSVINIGDELLLGIRENSHLTYLGQILSNYGAGIEQCLVVRDRKAEIESAVQSALVHSDVVILTGGLGPTVDDQTKEAVARSLGFRLIHDAHIEKSIRSRFDSLGRVMSENNLRQCQRPETSTVIENKYGTAPGLRLDYEGKTLYLLPGPTSELRPMMEDSVVPDLMRDGHLSESKGWLQLRCCGLGESAVEARLASIMERRKSVYLSFCAHAGIVDVRISPANPSVSIAEINKVGEECRLTLGENFFGFGNDCLAKILVLQLRCWNRTLAIAESCTGGMLSNAFTNIPGASKVFMGSVVAYTNASKVQMLDVPEPIILQHGAVSAETAVALATGAAERFSADYALSVTGYAGPEGGTAQDPVGTIYSAYFSPSGVWSQRSVLTGNRLEVKQRAVISTLDYARRTLNRYKVHDFLTCPGE